MRYLNLRPLIALGAAVVFGLAAFAQQNAPRGFDPANMCTTSCKACDDFYEYANGGWIAKNEIPPAFSSWGITSPLREKNIAMLHQILEDAAKNAAAPALEFGTFLSHGDVPQLDGAIGETPDCQQSSVRGESNWSEARNGSPGGPGGHVP